MRAGTSSRPISSKKSDMSVNSFFLAAGGYSLLLRICLRNAHGQIADAANYTYAFGHADSSARVEQVEQVRALERQLIRGQQREASLLSCRCFFVLKQLAGLGQQ